MSRAGTECAGTARRGMVSEWPRDEEGMQQQEEERRNAGKKREKKRKPPHAP